MLTLLEVESALQEIRTSACLHPLERDIAEHLATRPLANWCPGHRRMFDRIHRKAKGNL